VAPVRDVLRGVRVLEVAQWWFAPSASMLLAEWGAEVIKIEHPVNGDPIRGLVTGGVPRPDGLNFMAEQANHGKRSVGLDITTPDGKAVLDRLIGQADVFVTSFLPRLRSRLGLDVEDVRAVNPGIIYARAHGAGDQGPERGRPGFDAATFWARGGVAHHLTPPGSPTPLSPRPSFGDGISGLSLAGAIAAALYGRERHGEPSVIDVSLLGTALWVMSPDVVAAAAAPGGIPASTRDAARNPLSNCYRTSDGRWIWFVMLQADRYWPELCERIGRPDLASDERFRTARSRAEHLETCLAELDATFARHSLDQWREKLGGLSGAWAVSQSATELLTDPQVLANGYLAEVGYETGTHSLVTGPAQFDGQPAAVTRAPGVGEHTDEVLLELGSDWDEIIKLKVDGVIN